MTMTGNYDVVAIRAGLGFAESKCCNALCWLSNADLSLGMSPRIARVDALSNRTVYDFQMVFSTLRAPALSRKQTRSGAAKTICRAGIGVTVAKSGIKIGSVPYDICEPATLGVSVSRSSRASQTLEVKLVNSELQVMELSALQLKDPPADFQRRVSAKVRKGWAVGQKRIGKESPEICFANADSDELVLLVHEFGPVVAKRVLTSI